MKTFGWDTAFVLRADKVNELLRLRAGDTLLDFDTALPGAPGWTATGRFAPWQLSEGGSVEIVHLALGISEGTLTDGSTRYDLAGLTLVIATHLRWLELSGREDLDFDVQRQGPDGDPPAPGELSVIALRDPASVLPPDKNALLAYALGAFLVANAGRLRFVFAAANLIPPGNGHNTWLTPVKNAYGYFLREGSTEAWLAVLSVTTDRDISGLQRTVDPAALDPAHEACFVIAEELWLTQLIAPSLGKALNADAGAFTYSVQDGVLRSNRRLYANPVRAGAIDYDPILDTVEVRSGTGSLQGRYAGSVDMKAGIGMTYTISADNPGVYRDGALRFEPDPSPRETHDADIPWYWFIGGLIVIAVVEVVVKVISDDLATQVSNDNGERLALGSYPPSSILWGGNGAFQVQDVGVDGALYARGAIALGG